MIISGEAMTAFFREVKKGAKELGISVKMDKNGKLSAKYKGEGEISKEGQLFMDAVEDKFVKININAIKNEKGTDSEYMFGGAFGGNELYGETIDGGWVSQYAVAKQTVIPSDLKSLDEHYGHPGQTSLHEITEAYIGAIIAKRENVTSSETGSLNPLYERSHNGAIPQSGIVRRGIFSNNKESWVEWQSDNGKLFKYSVLK